MNVPYEVGTVAKCCPKNKEKGKINLMSSYLKMKGLCWENGIGICTDIAASIVGSIRGFTFLQNNRKEENSDIITHCFLQSQ
jgi:hypothetical protein